MIRFLQLCHWLCQCSFSRRGLRWAEPTLLLLIFGAAVAYGGGGGDGPKKPAAPATRPSNWQPNAGTGDKAEPPKPEFKPLPKPHVELPVEVVGQEKPRHELKYRWRAGDVLRYKVSHNATVETTIQGSTQTADTTSNSVKLWRVSKITPEGNIVFDHVIEAVDMRQAMSGRQEVRYNSLTDEKPPHGYTQVAEAVGKTLSVVTISPSGEVLGREFKYIEAGASHNGQIVIPLPDEPAPVGTVWTVPVDVDVALEDRATKRIKTRQRFELLAVEKDLATISVETQVITPVNNPKVQAQLVQRLSKGTLTFDLKAGRVASQKMECDERVLGFSGGDSNMHYEMKFSEQLLPDKKEETATKKSETPPATATTEPKPAAAKPTAVTPTPKVATPQTQTAKTPVAGTAPKTAPGTTSPPKTATPPKPTRTK